MIGRGVAAQFLVAMAAIGCAGPDPTIPQLPVVGPIPVIRGPADGDDLLNDSPVGACVAALSVYIAPPDLTAVDKAIEAAGGGIGWIDVAVEGAQATETARYFHGSLEAAATAFGATKLALGGGGDRWIQVADGSDRQLLEFTTPKGRSVWQTAGSRRPVPCQPGS